MDTSQQLVLGAVHKGRPQSVKGGLSSADIFRTRGGGSSDVDVRTFLRIGFFKIYGVSAQTRGEGGEPGGLFAEGVNFSRQCSNGYNQNYIFGILFQ